jgi:hypothetical protein
MVYAIFMEDLNVSGGNKFIKSIKEMIISPHIQIALATGISIIVLAYVSKRLLTDPIGYLPLATPPFLMIIWEALSDRYKNSRICTAWYWIAAIFVATVLVILFHMI